MPHLPPPASTARTYVVSETRTQRLIRTGQAVPRFLHGVYPFVGRGVYELSPLSDSLSFTVPQHRTVETPYVRAGNSSDDLIYLAISANGSPVHYYPLGPRSDIDIAPSIGETHSAGTRLDICFAAPRGLAGSVIVDVGLVEIDEGAE